MGAIEQAFAPACDEIAQAVEHHHRMGAAIEDVDAVLAVDRHGGDVGKVPAVGQLSPILHDAVAMLVRAENGRHVVLPDVTLQYGLERESLLVIPGCATWRRPGIHNHDREYGFRARASRAPE